MDGVGLAAMDLIGGHQADAGMVVIAVVPVEEAAAENLGLFDVIEAPGEFRLVFQCFEVGFGERIIVGGVWPSM